MTQHVTAQLTIRKHPCVAQCQSGLYSVSWENCSMLWTHLIYFRNLQGWIHWSNQLSQCSKRSKPDIARLKQMITHLKTLHMKTSVSDWHHCTKKKVYGLLDGSWGKKRDVLDNRHDSLESGQHSFAKIPKFLHLTWGCKAAFCVCGVLGSEAVFERLIPSFSEVLVNSASLTIIDLFMIAVTSDHSQAVPYNCQEFLFFTFPNINIFGKIQNSNVWRSTIQKRLFEVFALFIAGDMRWIYSEGRHMPGLW